MSPSMSSIDHYFPILVASCAVHRYDTNYFLSHDLSPTPFLSFFLTFLFFYDDMIKFSRLFHNSIQITKQFKYLFEARFLLGVVASLVTTMTASYISRRGAAHWLLHIDARDSRRSRSCRMGFRRCDANLYGGNLPNRPL